jgi:hypothetical protein
VTIPAGERVGSIGRATLTFTVSDGGIVVIPRGAVSAGDGVR